MNLTKKRDKCKYILHKYGINEKVSDISDFNFLLDVFSNHPHWDEIVGCGISHIMPMLTKYKNVCFYIFRIDGTYTDISYLHAIKNRSSLQEIKNACRHAIFEIIADYKAKNVLFGKTRCPITGEILTMFNTHIDHYDLTFSELFNLWIKDKDIEYLKSKLNGRSDLNVETFFTDQDIIDDFIKLHNENTHLRAVTDIANTKILR